MSLSKQNHKNTNPKNYTLCTLWDAQFPTYREHWMLSTATSTEFGSASLGVGRTAGGTLGHLLARALLLLTSQTWDTGSPIADRRGGVGGRSLAGCSTVLIKSPSSYLSVWHSSLYGTVPTSLQTKFHLLEVRQKSGWAHGCRLCLAIFTMPR